MESLVSAESIRPAGFWLRVCAKLADVLVLNLIGAVTLWAVPVLYVVGARLPWLWIVLLGPFVLWVAYLAVYTSGGRQTLGYRLAGIKVTTSSGENVRFGRALLRSAMNAISYALIGWLVGLLDYLAASVRSKRTLHDIACGTRVIRVARPNSRALWISGVASVLLPVILVFGVIRPFFLQMYFIPSGGMWPTLRDGDHVALNKLSYRVSEPQYGDLVVFKGLPWASVDGRERDFMKRVVGLPGDVLEVKKDGYLYRNGVRLSEPYLLGQRMRYVMQPTAVPKGRVFVMGDNRNNSNDSHAWGPLDRSRLKGKVMAVYPRSWFWGSSPGRAAETPP